MRLWILFGCGVLVMAGAIWPFGNGTVELAPVPVHAAVTAKAPKAESPKREVIEVIDLARAYEPVPEAEEPTGTINPASFIPVPETPKPIPPAIDFNRGFERIEVMPRDVSAIQNGLLDFVPTPSESPGEFSFTPMAVPYAVGITQPIPPGAVIAAPVEHLTVAPRLLRSLFAQEERTRPLSLDEAELLGIVVPR
jgi:hypothetical protein